MDSLITEISELSSKGLDYNSLGKLVSRFDFSQLNYAPFIPELEKSDDYSRNILMMDPVEVAILHWPPGVESGVHFHQGFFGYVVILEGEGRDIVFHKKDDVLTNKKITHCFPGGIISEPDGVIHKIVNPSREKKLVTLHIYYPPLKSLEDMKIFNLPEGKIGTLAEEAKTASWSDQKGHFKNVEEKAFEYIPYSQLKNISHRTVIVRPKPPESKVQEMNTRYYEEQAEEYDNFDLNHKTRSAYTQKIDDLIIGELKKNEPDSVLGIAIGTGRRLNEIREKSGIDFSLTGIDPSRKMAGKSEERGISVIVSSFLDATLKEETFDSVIYLYAFGHIPSKTGRRETLLKINRHLNMGGTFYFDAFNIDDQSEWGPQAKKNFSKENLGKEGYETGDLFYKKSGGNEIAFLHYFSEEELTSLLENAGFQIETLKYVGYVKDSGKIMNDKTRGFFWIKAKKIKNL